MNYRYNFPNVVFYYRFVQINVKLNRKTMKKILITSMVGAFLALGVAYASIPVKQEKATASTEVNASADDVQTVINFSQLEANEVEDVDSILNEAKNNAGSMDQELLITLLLWFFLTPLAAHRWYRKKPVGWNILFILTGGGCGVWAIVDLVNILTDNF